MRVRVCLYVVCLYSCVIYVCLCVCVGGDWVCVSKCGRVCVGVHMSEIDSLPLFIRKNVHL